MSFLRWERYLKTRDFRQGSYHSGWDGYIGRSYIPSFQVQEDTSENPGEPNPNTQQQQPNEFSVLTRNLQAMVAQSTLHTDNSTAQHIIETRHEITTQVFTTPNVAQNEESVNPLKKLEALVKENKVQPAIQIKQNEVRKSEAEQLRDLQTFQTQLQSNQSNAQVKPNTFVPKTLGINKNNAPSKPKPELKNPNPNSETTKNKPKSQLKTDSGSFNFNTFLQSNLSQLPSSNIVNEASLKASLNIPSATANFIPSQQNVPFNENFLKEALNINSKDQKGEEKKKKALSNKSTTFSVVQRPLGNQAPVEVSQIENKATENQESKTEQKPNILENLFTNPSALGLNVPFSNPIKESEIGTQPVGPELLQNLMNNLGGSLPINPNVPIESQNLTSVTEVEKKSETIQIKEVSELNEEKDNQHNNQSEQ